MTPPAAAWGWPGGHGADVGCSPPPAVWPRVPAVAQGPAVPTSLSHGHPLHLPPMHPGAVLGRRAIQCQIWMKSLLCLRTAIKLPGCGWHDGEWVSRALESCLSSPAEWGHRALRWVFVHLSCVEGRGRQHPRSRPSHPHNRAPGGQGESRGSKLRGWALSAMQHMELLGGNAILSPAGQCHSTVMAPRGFSGAAAMRQGSHGVGAACSTCTPSFTGTPSSPGSSCTSGTLRTAIPNTFRAPHAPVMSHTL